MKFTQEKKEALQNYILEKIESNDPHLSSAVLHSFEINQSTLYKYLKELQDKQVIIKLKRGQYALTEKKQTYKLKRSQGELDSDTYAYMTCLFDWVKEFPNNVEQMWAYAFSEMTNNIMDHSQAENVHIVVEQSYLSTRVWLMDDGIGIFKKIKDFFKLDTVDEAIGELFKGKITTDSDNHSGEGIFFSSRMMDEFCIISDGKIFSHDKYNADFMTTIPLPFENGTIVMMKLSNHSNRNAKDVFAQYENEDGAFDKTVIKIKNIFDTAPISRSQAKRLCKGIEKFTRVELDFEEIDWMGQSFADQLFRVFTQANPQVQLLPVNMNPDVEAMYRHVK